MSLLEANGSQGYWNAVGALWTKQRRQPLWREHSDAVNNGWLAACLPKDPPQYLLKTDLFDEACAKGLYPLLSRRARRFVGIDTSHDIIVAARARHRDLSALVSDVRELPFSDGTFDCVVSNSTLDHFAKSDDIAASLRELYRVLAPGGTLLISMDNGKNPLVLLRNLLPFSLLNRLGIVPYYVGATLGPKQLITHLQQAGFEVRSEVQSLMHCPRVIAVAAAAICQRFFSRGTQSSFLRLLLRFEKLASWRWRFLSGYFVAVVAQKPQIPQP